MKFNPPKDACICEAFIPTVTLAERPDILLNTKETKVEGEAT